MPSAVAALVQLLLLLSAGRVTLAQHGPGVEEGAPENPRQPLSTILLHRQALSTDGAFNYAFRADNGLQQGETIAPDGSRRGGYSYVDPSGRTITVRYTAGKDGFKIIDGDPSAGAAAPPQQLRPQPQPQLTYQPQPQPQPQMAYQPQPRPQPQLIYQPQQQQLPYHPQPQQPTAYQAAPAFASTPRPPPPAVQYRPASRAPPLPYQQPVQHAQPAYQVMPRPEPAVPQASLGLFRSTAPATFPQRQQQQVPQVQQTPIEEPQEEQETGPHTFGQGYSFEFQG